MPKENPLLQKTLNDQRFALADLILVLIAGVAGLIKPELGFWLLPAALFPWVFRRLAGQALFQRTPFDWLMLIFLLTAVIACFAAYNKPAAAEKFFFILISILLYYALSGQPKENFAGVAAVFFSLGVGISLYHFLTSDFVNNPTDIAVINRITLWLTAARPALTWRPIPSGYVPGLVIITTSLATYWFVKSDKPSRRFLWWTVLVCFVVVGLAILSVKSASVWFAFFATAGVWVLGRLFVLSGLAKNRSGLFPWLVLFYLILVVASIYLFDPIASGHPSDFGSNSRPEVFFRAIYFLRDFPISGAGLASFSGIYSQYMLGIPYFYFSNSYNMFLDIAIEQGLLGGLAILLMYLGAIFQISRKIHDGATKFQYWLVMLVLIFSLVHSVMQDYLYNNTGTVLLFFPVAMAMMLAGNSASRYLAIFSFGNSGIPHPRKLFTEVIVIAFVLMAALLNLKKLESVWYSNWGAVQMAQVELLNFPEAGWPGIGIMPKLQDAESSLRISLRLNPENLTANYRLGLIYTLDRDFESASKYLETAYIEAPHHRGIKKALGYSYLWMGDLNRAQQFLAEVPETRSELDAYYWWWSNQGRTDLSLQTVLLLRDFASVESQP